MWCQSCPQQFRSDETGVVGFLVQWSCSCVGFCEARSELVCAGCSLSSSRFHTLTVGSGVRFSHVVMSCGVIIGLFKL